MVLGMKTRRHPGGTTVTTTTTTTHHPGADAKARGARPVRTKPTLKQRLLGPKKPRTTTAAPTRRRGMGTKRTAGTTTTPRRKTSIGDKVSGAMLKLRGSVTGNPGKKAAGTRRMHGTDGRGTRRYY